jgi:hypothetical protein
MWIVFSCYEGNFWFLLLVFIPFLLYAFIYRRSDPVFPALILGYGRSARSPFRLLGLSLRDLVSVLLVRPDLFTVSTRNYFLLPLSSLLNPVRCCLSLDFLGAARSGCFSLVLRILDAVGPHLGSIYSVARAALSCCRFWFCLCVHFPQQHHLCFKSDLCPWQQKD